MAPALSTTPTDGRCARTCGCRRAQDYLTVGHFYRSLRQAFAGLAERIGADALFCGDPQRQIGPGVLEWEGLAPVVDVASAQAAIDVVVAQGEGTQGHIENSHYWRFLQVRDELAGLTVADPGFQPAWPCAVNPVQKSPPRPKDRVHITHPVASRVVDLGNAVYNLMLRTLAHGFGGPDSVPARKALVDAAIDGMFAVAGLGRFLASLPANEEDHPGVHAGLTFAVTRGQLGLADPTAAWPLILERTREMADACRAEAGLGEPVAQTASALDAIADNLLAARPA